jgi:hypothetical protein
MNNLNLKFNSVMFYDIGKKEIIGRYSGFTFVPNINDNVKFDEDIFVVVKKVFDFNNNDICLFVSKEDFDT